MLINPDMELFPSTSYREEGSNGFGNNDEIAREVWMFGQKVGLECKEGDSAIVGRLKELEGRGGGGGVATL